MESSPLEPYLAKVTATQGRGEEEPSEKPVSTGQSHATAMHNSSMPDEHLLDPEQVAERYGCQIDFDNIARSAGLSEAVAAERLARDGKNELSPPKKLHPVLKYLKKLFGIFNSMLLVSSILAYILYIIDSSDLSNVHTPSHVIVVFVAVPGMHSASSVLYECWDRVLPGIQVRGHFGGLQGTLSEYWWLPYSLFF